jgi:hypothetical protein
LLLFSSTTHYQIANSFLCGFKNILGVLGLFIWPRLYEEKQKEIDQLHALAVTEISKYYQLVWSKIPPNIQQRLAFLKEKAQ